MVQRSGAGHVDTIARLDEIDIWGLNIYRNIGFWGLFDDWAAMTDRPMFVSEYGADAYNTLIHAEDGESQAEATRVLTQEIVDASVRGGTGICSGGVLFEFSDEWWKADGSWSEQDVGGIAPGGGPFPDETFNEEWWGIVDIHRNPRPAYDAYRDARSP